MSEDELPMSEDDIRMSEDESEPMSKDESTSSRLVRLAMSAEKRALAKSKGEEKRAPPRQLPLWPERLRGLPNPLARGALFRAGSPKKARRKYEREAIVSVQGVTLAYTGEELRQDDQDVFLQLVHFARLHPTGQKFEGTGLMILKALGLGRGKDNYARLKASIGRLAEGTIWVTYAVGQNKTRTFTGRLVGDLDYTEVAGDERNAKWLLTVDSKLVELFGKDVYTLIDWEQRQKLSPLEKWLHSFYSTHKEPMPYLVETIYGLCGSANTSLASFRQSLASALDKLIDEGFFSAAEIDNEDLVRVTRKRPDQQQQPLPL